jgi:hypothetical protein
MSFTQFEEDIQEILNEAEDELSSGLIRRKIIAALRRIEGLWNFEYMFAEELVSVPISNAPVLQYGVEWKTIFKVGIWSLDAVDASLPTHGGGATGFEGFLQRVNASDLTSNHYETLNDTNSWGLPLKYQLKNGAFVEHPTLQSEGDMIFRQQIQLYPPSDSLRNMTIVGYKYTAPYTDANAADDHWMLHYGRELLEAWTILSLTPALQDATLAKFYENLVPSAQEVLLKSEANADWEGLDETAEYVGESDI